MTRARLPSIHDDPRAGLSAHIATLKDVLVTVQESDRPVIERAIAHAEAALAQLESDSPEKQERGASSLRR